MATKSTLTHYIATPKPSAELGSLLPKMSMSDPGIIPLIIDNGPIQRPQSPGSPQKNIAAINPMMPAVFLSMVNSPLIIDSANQLNKLYRKRGSKHAAGAMLPPLSY